MRLVYGDDEYAALLDDEDKEIVLMRHFEQLSNQDVAQALGLTEPAASMRYLRAIRRLRKLLAEPADERALAEGDGEGRDQDAHGDGVDEEA